MGIVLGEALCFIAVVNKSHTLKSENPLDAVFALTELKFKGFFVSLRKIDIKLLCYRETLGALFTGNIMCLFLAHKLAEADSLTILIFTRNLAAINKSCFLRGKTG